jgi:hypothetical protein
VFFLTFAIVGFAFGFVFLRLDSESLLLSFFFFFVREMAGSDENNPGGIGLTNFQGTRPGFGCEISMLRL